MRYVSKGLITLGHTPSGEKQKKKKSAELRAVGKLLSCDVVFKRIFFYLNSRKR